jgi:hypothetical protein
MSTSPRAEYALSIEGDEVRCLTDGKILWVLRLSELRVIAEWTTDGGPFLDDYFCGFAAGWPACWYECPIEAFIGVVERFQVAVGAPLELGLANRTDFVSRVIWPSHLKGHQLFDYREGRPDSALGRLKAIVLPRIHSSVTLEVQRYLEAGRPANQPLQPPSGGQGPS